MKFTHLWIFDYLSANTLLLLLTSFTIFVLPLFPSSTYPVLYSAFFTLIFFMASYAIHKTSKPLLFITLALIILVWVSNLANLESLKILFRTCQFLFFFYLVSALIRQVAANQSVTARVIADAITGYLLLGFAFSLAVTVLASVHAGAYNFHGGALSSKTSTEMFPENVYYTFITFTTTGYGDFLPQTPLAKSLAILISVSGQLYIAVIIALLVGKYAANQITRQE
ncbi:ion channel [Flavihumibacter rivuli]|uniref:ion channel n=1 Tax=Flavihumibacter rivuli TaxID=2838156 RepID=UPI001BDEB465|nr:ion channel [Flavihumibacter rivuli]ULQ57158.1 ion channel [Flavihumibacter rivuli]